KEVNPHGLAFLSASPAASSDPLGAIAPLAAKSLEGLRQALKTAGSEASDVVRVTCFLSSLDNLAATRKLVEAEYPRATLNYVQTQRAPGRAVGACEAVARAGANGSDRIRFVPVEGGPKAVVVNSPKVVLSGSQ